jgi:hypothetical protein
VRAFSEHEPRAVASLESETPCPRIRHRRWSLQRRRCPERGRRSGWAARPRCLSPHRVRLSGAAPESNGPSRGLHGRTGLEDRFADAVRVVDLIRHRRASRDYITCGAAPFSVMGTQNPLFMRASPCRRAKKEGGCTSRRTPTKTFCCHRGRSPCKSLWAARIRTRDLGIKVPLDKLQPTETCCKLRESPLQRTASSCSVRRQACSPTLHPLRWLSRQRTHVSCKNGGHQAKGRSC